MPDDHNDNNSQTPREPKIPGMPGGKKPTRTGWLYFILACALLGYAFFNMGSGFANSSNTVKLATSEMVSAIKQDRVEDLTYTVQDGSVTGHYWKTKKDKGDTSELKSFSSTYVGSDSLAELMAEHPDTKYIVNTNDPDFLGRLGDECASDDRPYRHHVLLYAPDDGRQQQEHAVWQDQRQDQRGHTPQGQV